MTKYGAMTVNERLFTAGALEAFDQAVRDGNRDQMIALLVTVEIDEIEARKIVEAVLAHPTRYGRC